MGGVYLNPQATLLHFLYYGEEVGVYGFGGLLHFVFYPPFYGFHEGGGDVVFPEGVGDVGAFVGGEQGELAFYEKLQVAAEIAQEQLVVWGGQQHQNVIVVLLQVAQQVEKHGVGAVAVEDMLMVVGVLLSVEDMAEQFFAKLLQQIIFRFKMGIEGGSAYICFFNDFSNGDMIEILLGEQVCEAPENGFTGFSLPSVHGFPPYNFMDLFRIIYAGGIVCCGGRVF